MKDPDRPRDGPFEPTLAHFLHPPKKIERKNTGNRGEEKEYRTAHAPDDVTAGPSTPRDSPAHARCAPVTSRRSRPPRARRLLGRSRSLLHCGLSPLRGPNPAAGAECVFSQVFLLHGVVWPRQAVTRAPRRRRCYRRLHLRRT